MTEDNKKVDGQIKKILEENKNISDEIKKIQEDNSKNYQNILQELKQLLPHKPSLSEEEIKLN